MERLLYDIDDFLQMLILQKNSRKNLLPPENFKGNNEDTFKIILVPGLLEYWGVLLKYGLLSARLGHNVHVVRQLGNNIATIQKSSETIKRYIDENIDGEVFAITHSKGGIIGKQLLLDGYLQGLIAIATPFSGSEAAESIPILWPFKELRKESATILNLLNNDSVNEKIISIFPTYDNLISSGSYIDGGDNIHIPSKGHHKILTSALTLKVVENVIKKWEKTYKSK